MLRRILLLLVLVGLLINGAIAQDEPSGDGDAPFRLMFLGEATLATDTAYDGFPVGGLSAITLNPRYDTFLAISDVSDDLARLGPPRFYTLKLDMDADGVYGVEILAMNVIYANNHEEFYPRGDLDAEGLRFVPGTPKMLWTSERDRAGVPALREMRLDGVNLRDFTLPEAYIPAGTRRGVRLNQSLEALALFVTDANDASSDKQIFIGTENGLAQDDPAMSRILQLDYATGTALAEWVYPLEDIDGNGLSELLAVDATTLLALERAYSSGVGNTISLFTVDFSDATDILGAETISETDIPVTKTPVLTLHEGDFGLDIDNIEGVTWGPEIDGKRTLVFVSDNNFNPVSQPFTQFLVFTVHDLP